MVINLWVFQFPRSVPQKRGLLVEETTNLSFWKLVFSPFSNSLDLTFFLVFLPKFACENWQRLHIYKFGVMAFKIKSNSQSFKIKKEKCRGESCKIWISSIHLWLYFHAWKANLQSILLEAIFYYLFEQYKDSGFFSIVRNVFLNF